MQQGSFTTYSYIKQNSIYWKPNASIFNMLKTIIQSLLQKKGDKVMDKVRGGCLCTNKFENLLDFF